MSKIALVRALASGMAFLPDDAEWEAAQSLALITRALSAACSIVEEKSGREMLTLRDALEGFNGVFTDLLLRDGVVIKY